MCVWGGVELAVVRRRRQHSRAAVCGHFMVHQPAQSPSNRPSRGLSRSGTGRMVAASSLLRIPRRLHVQQCILTRLATFAPSHRIAPHAALHAHLEARRPDASSAARRGRATRACTVHASAVHRPPARPHPKPLKPAQSISGGESIKKQAEFGLARSLSRSAAVITLFPPSFSGRCCTLVVMVLAVFGSGPHRRKE